MEEQLKVSFKEIGDLRAALDEHAIVATTDPLGRITYVNDKFCSISKYSRKDLIGQDHRIINSGYHPKEFFNNLWATIISGKIWHGEIKNKAKDGSFYWEDTMIVPLCDARGEPQQYVAIRADITERKRTEIALRQSAAIVDSSEDAIIGADLSGVVISWNKGAERLFAYTAGEMIGSSIMRLIPAHRHEEEKLTLTKIGRGERMEPFETQRQSKDRRILHVSVIASPTKDTEGYISGVSQVTRDVTAQKQAEEIVQQASGHVARGRSKQVRIDLAILIIAAASIYTLALTLNWFEAATRWFLAHDVEKLDEIILTSIFVVAGLAVFAYRRWREAKLEMATRHQVQTAMGLLHTELERRVSQRTEELDRANATLRTQATERRQAESELRESNRRFKEMLENIALIAMTLDKSGTIMFCNDFLLRLTGWKREEVIGRVWFDLFLPDSATAAEQLFLATIEAGEIPPHYQNLIKTRAGELRDIVWNNTMLRDGAGNVIGTASIGEDVTERARSEAELRESELKFALAFANNPAAIALTRLEDGLVLEVNDTWVALCEFSREEMVGRSARSTWPTLGAAERFERELREKGVLRGWEQEFRKKSGEMFVAEVSSQVLKINGEKVILSTLVDVTARKRAEEAMRTSEERFRQVVENIHEVFWMTDPAENQMLYISPAYETVWGRTRESLYGDPNSWLESIYPDDRERVTLAAGTKQTRGDYDETYRITRPDGAVRWIRDRAFPIRDSAGAVRRLVGTAEDITEYRTLEEQFRQAQKMEAIGTLAGGIAHDFNNILAAINGYTELARMVLKENPEVRDHLGAVLQASGRAADLVRQILTFSRQQSQERRPIQLRPIVVECLNLLRATLPSTIEFDLSLATDAPTVLADAIQIHQVLMNLGTNAWHAMKERTGRLQVRLERCTVDAAHAAGQSQLRPGIYAHVSISDTGCGMDQATLRRIFEPFFTTKPPGQGTGLGLSVVHGIMDSHDGAVTVYSQPGEGTVFHLYFPAHTGEAITTTPAGEPVPHGHGERILFVDDEELLVRLGQKTLAALGYVVDVATQPALALAMVRAEPERFALVLTDHTMPGMTGLDLASLVLQIRPDLPIILMTGYTASLTAERVNATGICQLLLKPTTLHSLGTAVHRALAIQTPL